MVKIILRWIINALVLMGLTYIVPGVYFTNFYAALIAALVLGIVNAILKPILVVLTLPINIITLGLFTLVINGLLFWLVSTFVKGFFVADFWSAFLAALVFSIISIFLSWLDRGFDSKDH